MRKIIFLRHPKMIWVSDSVKWEEEKISSHPLAGDACGFANAGARAITHRAILVKLTYTRTGAVANGAIFINLANAGTRTVTDSAVAVEPADAGTAGIADGAVTLNLATARTATIVNGLCHCTRCHYYGYGHE